MLVYQRVDRLTVCLSRLQEPISCISMNQLRFLQQRFPLLRHQGPWEGQAPPSPGSRLSGMSGMSGSPNWCNEFQSSKIYGNLPANCCALYTSATLKYNYIEAFGLPKCFRLGVCGEIHSWQSWSAKSDWATWILLATLRAYGSWLKTSFWRLLTSIARSSQEPKAMVYLQVPEQPEPSFRFGESI